MKIEYTIINPYYIEETSTGKKYNHKETCKLLNHQSRIIKMKSELIKKLLNTNTALTKTVNRLEKEKKTTLKRGKKHEAYTKKD